MTEDQLNPLRRECVRTDWKRSDDHDWQGQRSDGTPIGPYNDQATVDDVIRRERREAETPSGPDFTRSMDDRADQVHAEDAA